MNGRMNEQMSLCQLGMCIILSYSSKPTRTNKRDKEADSEEAGRREEETRDRSMESKKGWWILYSLSLSFYSSLGAVFPCPMVLTLLSLGNKAIVLAGTP